MKKRRVLILLILFIAALATYFLLTNYPGVTHTYSLNNGVVIELSFSENKLVLTDPEIDKNLEILYPDGAYVEYTDWSEDFLYDLTLMNVEDDTFWLITDRYMGNLVCSYPDGEEFFEKGFDYEVALNADTICHLSFDNEDIKIDDRSE